MMPRCHHRYMRTPVASATPARSKQSMGLCQCARMINDLWYKNAVIYCLYVGTYMDSNGDGIGDFQGLDAPAGLPARARRHRLWLMPFQTSPLPRRRLRHRRLLRRRSALRHPRRLRRVHPRREAARHARADRPRRQPHLGRASVVPGGAPRSAVEVPRLVRLVEEEAAARRRGRGVSRACRRRPGATTRRRRLYYFHRFYDFQPDLNTSNPQVQAEILKIMGFWMQLGVSGFRMDAVPFVIGTKGARREEAGRAVRHAARPARVPAVAPGRRRSSSPRPTCCPRPTWTTSATTASACR